MAKKSAKKASKKTSKKTAKKTSKKSAKKSSKSTKSSKKSSKKSAKRVRHVSSRRELINTGVDKRYVRRRKDGTFKESDDVSRSLSADARHHAKTDAPRGQGDKGD